MTRALIQATWDASARVAEMRGQFQARVFNALVSARLKTVSDVAGCPDWGLLKQPNFGLGSLRELRKVIPYDEGVRDFVRWPMGGGA